MTLRRRSSDWHVYVFSMFGGILGGVYIFLEPLRELYALEKDDEEKPSNR